VDESSDDADWAYAQRREDFVEECPTGTLRLPRLLVRTLLLQGERPKVANLLTPGNHDPWLDVRDALNGFLFGWARYFTYGTHRAAFRGIDYYVYERVRDFLARRHKIKGRGTKRFSYNVVYGERGVLRLERLPWSLAPCASR
jgi:RNA-directed DNA polymerase